jgi:hypothetical protein
VRKPGKEGIVDVNLRSGIEDSVRAAARNVFRTDVHHPGFAHLVLHGQSLSSEEFAALVADTAHGLAEEYRRDFGRELQLVSQGSFDQQATTGAHRDGGPDESILVLGYEPTPVRSRLLIFDYTKAAVDLDISPVEFLATHNPIYPEGRALLEGYVAEVPDFDPNWHHIVIINNGNRGCEDRHTGMLGVLHQGIIPRPDPSARRMIHSIMLVQEASCDLEEKSCAASVRGYSGQTNGVS